MPALEKSHSITGKAKIDHKNFKVTFHMSNFSRKKSFLKPRSRLQLMIKKLALKKRRRLLHWLRFIELWL